MEWFIAYLVIATLVMPFTSEYGSSMARYITCLFWPLHAVMMLFVMVIGIVIGLFRFIRG